MTVKDSRDDNLSERDDVLTFTAMTVGRKESTLDALLPLADL